MKPTGSMHAARVDGSPRLQRLLAFLRRRGMDGATTIEICVNCSAPNPATYEIEAKCEGQNENRAQIWRYRLIENGERRLF